MIEERMLTVYAEVCQASQEHEALRWRCLCSGSHFDEYVAEYLAWRPGAPPSSAFNPPSECAGVAAQKAPSPRPFALRMAALMPSTARIGVPRTLNDRV